MKEELHSLLLQTLAARSNGQGGEVGSNAQELLLSQLADSADPTTAAIARYLAQRQVEQVEADADLEPDSDDEDEENIAPANELDQLRRETRALAHQRLRRLVERLYAELEILRERNDVLATALGACYLCWGEDRDCPECEGRGHPGSQIPDRRLFREWVQPAVRQLEEQESSDVRRRVQQRNARDPQSKDVHERRVQ